MRDVIAQQLPALGMALLGVDASELAVDDVEALDRRQLVLETSEAEMTWPILNPLPTTVGDDVFLVSR